MEPGATFSKERTTQHKSIKMFPSPKIEAYFCQSSWGHPLHEVQRNE